MNATAKQAYSFCGASPKEESTKCGKEETTGIRALKFW